MGRAPCCSKEGLNRGAWTRTEDMILTEYIRIHGDGRWRKLPKKAGLKRCGKSCRLRWLNYLRPDIPDEEELIIRMHRLLGNRWSLIAGRLPGRTDNEIKNYWNTHLKKKVLMDECQSKTQNLKPGTESRPLQNGVFKTTPVKITTPVRYHERVTLNRCSNTGNSDLAFKMFNVPETTNSSKSWYDLFLNDLIPEDDSELVAFRMWDGNLVETEAGREFLHSNQFAGNSGFGFEDFHSGAATLDAEMHELQYQSNLRQDNSFTVSGYPRLKEIYDSTEPVDWNHVLNDILN